ncbi:MAG: Gfo/Idh/MocA family protein [Acidobacteriota bacterium]
MRELAFAVIGAGFWGQFQVAAWKEMPGARLVALCDRNQVKAAAVAQKFEIPKIYSEADEMLRSETLDFVDVAAGPEAHAPLVLLAASRRIPVICQKPMALDYPTCERMVRACQETGTIFLVHENYRWQTPMRRVKELLGSARIGRPFRAHIQFSHGDLRLFDSQPYLYTQPHFALQDMGPHLLDLPRFFFGEPHSLYAREFKINPRFQGEDIVSVVLGYEQLTCHCELSWRTTDYEVFIEGTQGTIHWGTSGRLTVVTDSAETTETPIPDSYPWSDPRYGFAHPSIVATNANLLAALRGEGEAETTGEDNLKTMRLLHLALESAARNQVLSIGPTER